MQRHKIVRKASIGVLLLLPLVAVGVALTIMLSWGHQGAQQAEANTPIAEWTMEVKGLNQTGSTDPCTTKKAGPVVCNVPLDTGFTVSVFVNDLGKLVANLEQAALLWTPGIIGPGDPGSTKTAANAVTADCPKGISATAAPFLGVAGSAGGTCVAFPPPYDPDQALAVRFEFDLNCGPNPGSETVTMQSNVPANTGTYIEDEAKGDVAANAGQITIICTPPDAQINISVVDADLQTQKVDGSCWLISAEIPSGVSEPPTINKPVDVVSDNNAQAECDGIGPIKADLSDKNPAVGQIDITISGKTRVAFGDSWHVQQVKSNTKYILDPTKYACDTSQPKTGSSTAVGCDVVVKNTQVNGNLTVNFALNPIGQDPTDLGPVIVVNDPPDNVVCVNVTGATNGDQGQFCTTAGGSTIGLPLAAPDTYTVTFKGCPDPLEIDLTKVDAAGNPIQQNPQVLALGHALPGGIKQIEANFSCHTVKVLNLKTPGAANLFLTNQTGKQKPGGEDGLPEGYAPSSCRDGTDTALFTHALSIEPGSTVPKSTIDPKTGEITPSTVPQRVAAFSMDVLVKPEQAALVCLNIVPGDYFFLLGTGNNPFAGLTGQALVDKVQSFHDISDPAGLEQANLGAVSCFINDVNDGTEPKGAATIGCVSKVRGFDRIEVSVGKAIQFFKIATISFTCQTTGEIVAGTFKDHVKDANPGDPLPDNEVWGGTFSAECNGAVDVAASPVITSNDLVITEAEVSNGKTGNAQAVGCKKTSADPQEWQCGDVVDLSDEFDQRLPMAYILVKPSEDLYSLIKADQENGVVVQILNSQCNFADSQAHEIQTSNCPDSDLTIRWLEGDVNADCVVDAIDQQLLAFRWGADFASLLFDQRYDLVDTSGGVAGAATINIKDVQFVFGRHGSKCDEFNQEGFNGPTFPPQPPVSKK